MAVQLVLDRGLPAQPALATPPAASLLRSAWAVPLAPAAIDVRRPSPEDAEARAAFFALSGTLLVATLTAALGLVWMLASLPVA